MKNYVPRHVRLGCIDLPVIRDMSVNLRQSVPFLDDDGNVVSKRILSTRVSISEYYSTYQLSDFKIDNLLEAGVPLKVLNVNGSISDEIDRLSDVVNNLDRLDELKKLVEKQSLEREKFFNTDGNTGT